MAIRVCIGVLAAVSLLARYFRLGDLKTGGGCTKELLTFHGGGRRFGRGVDLGRASSYALRPIRTSSGHPARYTASGCRRVATRFSGETIVAYVRSMNAPGRPQGRKGDAVRGKRYSRQGRSLNCHRVQRRRLSCRPRPHDIGKLRRSSDPLELSILEPDAEMLLRTVRPLVTRDGSTTMGTSHQDTSPCR